jgi:hypothetical protein
MRERAENQLGQSRMSSKRRAHRASATIIWREGEDGMPLIGLMLPAGDWRAAKIVLSEAVELDGKPVSERDQLRHARHSSRRPTRAVLH